MATINYTITRKGKWWEIFWETVTEADTCQPVYINDNISDAWLEATGTWGGATVGIDGGDDSSPAHAIEDPTGTAISLSDAADSRSAALRDVPPYVQPVPAGGSSQDLDITLRLRVVN